ncbi:MAG: M24 family metallopeptidase [Candidatus Omnitrophica bacterium]|nr:M24 family metallopeptidase [Candidatus Omnitrophota bacterium]
MVNWRNKPWIKAIAWLIVLTFLPEQVAWAVDYNWRGVLNGQGISAVTSAAVATDASVLRKNLSAKDLVADEASDKVIAGAIKDALSQLVGKEATDIRLSDEVIVHRTYPLAITEDKVAELYAWMLDPAHDLVTCGALSLAGMLGLMGRRASSVQIAHYALLVDILSDSLNIYTYNKDKRLESSLYALAKTSALFGLDLKPFHFEEFELDNKAFAKALNKLIPFIAFVDDDHMVLVKGLSKEGLIIEDNGKENILSRSETSARFSGYGLVRAGADTFGLKVEFLEDEVAKAIRGTRREITKYDGYDFSGYFPKHDDSDAWKALGTMAGMAALNYVCPTCGYAVGVGLGVYNGAKALNDGNTMGAVFSFASAAMSASNLYSQYSASQTRPYSTNEVPYAQAVSHSPSDSGYLPSYLSDGASSGVSSGSSTAPQYTPGTGMPPYAQATTYNAPSTAQPTSSYTSQFIQNFVVNMGKSLVVGQIATAATNVAANEFGWSPQGSQIFGSAVGAMASAGVSYGDTGSGRLNENTKTFNFFKDVLGIENDYYANIIAAGVRGAARGAAKVYILDKYADSKDLFTQIGVNSATGVLTDAATNTLLSGMGFDTYHRVADGTTPKRITTTNFVKEGAGFFDRIFAEAKMSLPFVGVGKVEDIEIRKNFIESFVSTAVEKVSDKYQIFGENTNLYSKDLGRNMGSFIYRLAENKEAKDIAMEVFRNTTVRLAFNALGGKYDKATGKNEWGLSKVDMAILTYYDSVALSSMFSSDPAKASADNMAEVSKGFWSFGGTAPWVKEKDGTSLYSGYREGQFIDGILQMSGVYYLNEAVNDSIKKKQSSSWDDFKAKGGLTTVARRGLDNWLVEYVSSSLNQAAAANMGALMGHGVDAVFGGLKGASNADIAKGAEVAGIKKPTGEVYTESDLQNMANKNPRGRENLVNDIEDLLNSKPDLWQQMPWSTRPMGAPGTFTGSLLGGLGVGSDGAKAVMNWSLRDFGEPGTLTGFVKTYIYGDATHAGILAGTVNTIFRTDLGGLFFQSAGRGTLFQEANPINRYTFTAGNDGQSILDTSLYFKDRGSDKTQFSIDANGDIKMGGKSGDAFNVSAVLRSEGYDSNKATVLGATEWHQVIVGQPKKSEDTSSLAMSARQLPEAEVRSLETMVQGINAPKARLTVGDRETGGLMVSFEKSGNTVTGQANFTLNPDGTIKSYDYITKGAKSTIYPGDYGTVRIGGKVEKQNPVIPQASTVPAGTVTAETAIPGDLVTPSDLNNSINNLKSEIVKFKAEVIEQQQTPGGPEASLSNVQKLVGMEQRLETLEKSSAEVPSRVSAVPASKPSDNIPTERIEDTILTNLTRAQEMGKMADSNQISGSTAIPPKDYKLDTKIVHQNGGVSYTGPAGMQVIDDGKTAILPTYDKAGNLVKQSMYGLDGNKSASLIYEEANFKRDSDGNLISNDRITYKNNAPIMTQEFIYGVKGVSSPTEIIATNHLAAGDKKERITALPDSVLEPTADGKGYKNYDLTQLGENGTVIGKTTQHRTLADGTETTVIPGTGSVVTKKTPAYSLNVPSLGETNKDPSKFSASFDYGQIIVRSPDKNTLIISNASGPNKGTTAILLNPAAPTLDPDVRNADKIMRFDSPISDTSLLSGGAEALKNFTPDETKIATRVGGITYDLNSGAINIMDAEQERIGLKQSIFGVEQKFDTVTRVSAGLQVETKQSVNGIPEYTHKYSYNNFGSPKINITEHLDNNRNYSVERDAKGKQIITIPKGERINSGSNLIADSEITLNHEGKPLAEAYLHESKNVWKMGLDGKIFPYTGDFSASDKSGQTMHYEKGMRAGADIKENQIAIVNQYKKDPNSASAKEFLTAIQKVDKNISLNDSRLTDGVAGPLTQAMFDFNNQKYNEYVGKVVKALQGIPGMNESKVRKGLGETIMYFGDNGTYIKQEGGWKKAGDSGSQLYDIKESAEKDKGWQIAPIGGQPVSSSSIVANQPQNTGFSLFGQAYGATPPVGRSTVGNVKTDQPSGLGDSFDFRKANDEAMNPSPLGVLMGQDMKRYEQEAAPLGSGAVKTVETSKAATSPHAFLEGAVGSIVDNSQTQRSSGKSLDEVRSVPMDELQKTFGGQQGPVTDDGFTSHWKGVPQEYKLKNGNIEVIMPLGFKNGDDACYDCHDKTKETVGIVPIRRSIKDEAGNEIAGETKIGEAFGSIKTNEVQYLIDVETNPHGAYLLRSPTLFDHVASGDSFDFRKASEEAMNPISLGVITSQDAKRLEQEVVPLGSFVRTTEQATADHYAAIQNALLDKESQMQIFMFMLPKGEGSGTSAFLTTDGRYATPISNASGNSVALKGRGVLELKEASDGSVMVADKNWTPGSKIDYLYLEPGQNLSWQHKAKNIGGEPQATLTPSAQGSAYSLKVGPDGDIDVRSVNGEAFDGQGNKAYFASHLTLDYGKSQAQYFMEDNKSVDITHPDRVWINGNRIEGEVIGHSLQDEGRPVIKIVTFKAKGPLGLDLGEYGQYLEVNMQKGASRDMVAGEKFIGLDNKGKEILSGYGEGKLEDKGIGRIDNPNSSAVEYLGLKTFASLGGAASKGLQWFTDHSLIYQLLVDKGVVDSQAFNKRAEMAFVAARNFDNGLIDTGWADLSPVSKSEALNLSVDAASKIFDIYIAGKVASVAFRFGMGLIAKQAAEEGAKEVATEWGKNFVKDIVFTQAGSRAVKSAGLGLANVAGAKYLNPDMDLGSWEAGTIFLTTFGVDYLTRGFNLGSAARAETLMKGVGSELKAGAGAWESVAAGSEAAVYSRPWMTAKGVGLAGLGGFTRYAAIGTLETSVADYAKTGEAHVWNNFVNVGLPAGIFGAIGQGASVATKALYPMAKKAAVGGWSDFAGRTALTMTGVGGHYAAISLNVDNAINRVFTNDARPAFLDNMKSGAYDFGFGALVFGGPIMLAGYAKTAESKTALAVLSGAGINVGAGYIRSKLNGQEYTLNNGLLDAMIGGGLGALAGNLRYKAEGSKSLWESMAQPGSKGVLWTAAFGAGASTLSGLVERGIGSFEVGRSLGFSPVGGLGMDLLAGGLAGSIGKGLTTSTAANWANKYLNFDLFASKLGFGDTGKTIGKVIFRVGVAPIAAGAATGGLTAAWDLGKSVISDSEFNFSQSFSKGFGPGWYLGETAAMASLGLGLKEHAGGIAGRVAEIYQAPSLLFTTEADLKAAGIARNSDAWSKSLQFSTLHGSKIWPAVSVSFTIANNVVSNTLAIAGEEGRALIRGERLFESGAWKAGFFALRDESGKLQRNELGQPMTLFSEQGGKQLAMSAVEGRKSGFMMHPLIGIMMQPAKEIGIGEATHAEFMMSEHGLVSRPLAYLKSRMEYFGKDVVTRRDLFTKEMFEFRNTRIGNALAFADSVAFMATYTTAWDKLAQAAGFSKSDAQAAGWVNFFLVPTTRMVSFADSGSKAFSNGDYSGAIKDLTKNAELNPDDATAHLALAQAHSAAGNTDLAIKSLEKAGSLAMEAGDIKLHEKIFEQRLGLKGIEAHKAGKSELSVTYFDHAYKLNSSAENKVNLSAAHYNLSLQQAKAGDIKPAIESLDKAISLTQGTEHADLHNSALEMKSHLLGVDALNNKNNPIEAIEHFTKAVELNPSNENMKNLSIAYAKLGSQQAKAGDVTPAAESFDKAGSWAKKAGDKEFRKSILIEKFNLKFNEAFDNEDFAKAVSAAKGIRKLDRENPFAHYNEGLARFKNKDNAGAIKSWRQSEVLRFIGDWDFKGFRSPGDLADDIEKHFLQKETPESSNVPVAPEMQKMEILQPSGIVNDLGDHTHGLNIVDKAGMRLDPIETYQIKKYINAVKDNLPLTPQQTDAIYNYRVLQRAIEVLSVHEKLNPSEETKQILKASREAKSEYDKVMPQEHIDTLHSAWQELQQTGSTHGLSKVFESSKVPEMPKTTTPRTFSEGIDAIKAITKYAEEKGLHTKAGQAGLDASDEINKLVEDAWDWAGKVFDSASYQPVEDMSDLKPGVVLKGPDGRLRIITEVNENGVRSIDLLRHGLPREGSLAPYDAAIFAKGKIYNYEIVVPKTESPEMPKMPDEQPLPTAPIRSISHLEETGFSVGDIVNVRPGVLGDEIGNLRITRIDDQGRILDAVGVKNSYGRGEGIPIISDGKLTSIQDRWKAEDSNKAPEMPKMSQQPLPKTTVETPKIEQPQMPKPPAMKSLGGEIRSLVANYDALEIEIDGLFRNHDKELNSILKTHQGEEYDRQTALLIQEYEVQSHKYYEQRRSLKNEIIDKIKNSDEIKSLSQNIMDVWKSHGSNETSKFIEKLQQVLPQGYKINIIETETQNPSSKYDASENWHVMEIKDPAGQFSLVLPRRNYPFTDTLNNYVSSKAENPRNATVKELVSPGIRANFGGEWRVFEKGIIKTNFELENQPKGNEPQSLGAASAAKDIFESSKIPDLAGKPVGYEFEHNGMPHRIESIGSDGTPFVKVITSDANRINGPPAFDTNRLDSLRPISHTMPRGIAIDGLRAPGISSKAQTNNFNQGSTYDKKVDQEYRALSKFITETVYKDADPNDLMAVSRKERIENSAKAYAERYKFIGLEASQGSGKTTAGALEFAIMNLRRNTKIVLEYASETVRNQTREFLNKPEVKQVFESKEYGIGKMPTIFVVTKESFSNPNLFEDIKKADIVMIEDYDRDVLRGTAVEHAVTLNSGRNYYRDSFEELARRANLIEEGSALTSRPGVTLANHQVGLDRREEGVAKRGFDVFLKVVSAIKEGKTEIPAAINIDNYIKDDSLQKQIVAPKNIEAWISEIVDEDMMHGVKYQLSPLGVRFKAESKIETAYLSLLGVDTMHFKGENGWRKLGEEIGSDRANEYRYALNSIARALYELKPGTMTTSVFTLDKDGRKVPISPYAADQKAEDVREHDAVVAAMRELIHNPLYERPIDLEHIETGKTTLLVTSQDHFRDINKYGGTAMVTGGGLRGVQDALESQFGLKFYFEQPLEKDKLAGVRHADYTEIITDPSLTLRASKQLEKAVLDAVEQGSISRNGRNIFVTLPMELKNSQDVVSVFRNILPEIKMIFTDSTDKTYWIPEHLTNFNEIQDAISNSRLKEVKADELGTIHEKYKGELLHVVNGSGRGLDLKFEGVPLTFISVADNLSPIERVRQSYRLRFQGEDAKLIVLNMPGKEGLSQEVLRKEVADLFRRNQSFMEKEVAVEKALTLFSEVYHRRLNTMIEAEAKNKNLAAVKELERVRDSWRDQNQIFMGAYRGLEKTDDALQRAINNVQSLFERDLGKGSQAYKLMSSEVWREHVGTALEEVAKDSNALVLSLGTGKGATSYYEPTTLKDAVTSVNYWNNLEKIAPVTTGFSGDVFRVAMGKPQSRGVSLSATQETAPIEVRAYIKSLTEPLRLQLPEADYAQLQQTLYERMKGVPGLFEQHPTEPAKEVFAHNQALPFLVASIQTATPEEKKVFNSARPALVAFNLPQLPEDRKHMTALEAFDAAIQIIESGAIQIHNLNGQGLGQIMQAAPLGELVKLGKAAPLTVEQFGVFSRATVSDPVLAVKETAVKLLRDDSLRTEIMKQISSQRPAWHEVQTNPNPNLANLQERKAHEKRWADVYSDSVGTIRSMTKLIYGKAEQPTFKETVPLFGLFAPGVQPADTKKIFRQFSLLEEHAFNPINSGLSDDITLGGLLFARIQDSFFKTADFSKISDRFLRNVFNQAQKRMDEYQEIPMQYADKIKDISQRYGFMMLAGGGYRTRKQLREFDDMLSGLKENIGRRSGMMPIRILTSQSQEEWLDYLQNSLPKFSMKPQASFARGIVQIINQSLMAPSQPITPLKLDNIIQNLNKNFGSSAAVAKEKIYGLVGLGGNRIGGRMDRYAVNEGIYRAYRYFESGKELIDPLDNISVWHLASNNFIRKHSSAFGLPKEFAVAYVERKAADSTYEAKIIAQKDIFGILAQLPKGELQQISNALKQNASLKQEAKEKADSFLRQKHPVAFDLMDDIQRTLLSGTQGVMTTNKFGQNNRLGMEFWRFVDPLRILTALEGMRISLGKIQARANQAKGAREIVLRELLGAKDQLSRDAVDRTREDFELVHGKDMMKSGIATAENNFLEDGTVSIRLRGAGLTPETKLIGKHNSFVDTHEIPHEMLHVAIDTLNQWGFVPSNVNLDGVFGKGFEKDFLDSRRRLLVDLSLGPDGTYNELLATTGSLGYVARYASRKDSGQQTPALSLIGSTGLQFLDSIKHGVVSFRERREAIEYHKPELQQVLIKTHKEINLMGKAARLANEAVESVKPKIAEGVGKLSELDVENLIRFEFESRGIRATTPDGLPLGITVAFGENINDFTKEKPKEHESTPDRILKDGDVVRIDFGATYKKFNSDKTIVFGVGNVSQDFVDTYNKVVGIRKEISNLFRPGAKTTQIRSALNEVYRKYNVPTPGYDIFIHGIGRDVHETILTEKRDIELKEGMVFAFEPSIDGLRIEDMIAITKDGHRILSGQQHQSLEILFPSQSAKASLISNNNKAQYLRDWYKKVFDSGDTGISSFGSTAHISWVSLDPNLRLSLTREITGRLGKANSVLSIGIGSGVLEEDLKHSGLNVTGVDIAPNLLERARDKGIHVLNASGENLPIGDETFDAVILSESIGHMDLPRVLSEANRVLRPGGAIHITTYTQNSEFLKNALYDAHSEAILLSALADAGFQNAEVAMEQDERQGFIYIRAGKPEQPILGQQSMLPQPLERPVQAGDYLKELGKIRLNGSGKITVSELIGREALVLHTEGIGGRSTLPIPRNMAQNKGVELQGQLFDINEDYKVSYVDGIENKWSIALGNKEMGSFKSVSSPLAPAASSPMVNELPGFAGKAAMAALTTLPMETIDNYGVRGPPDGMQDISLPKLSYSSAISPATTKSLESTALIPLTGSLDTLNSPFDTSMSSPISAKGKIVAWTLAASLAAWTLAASLAATVPYYLWNQRQGDRLLDSNTAIYTSASQVNLADDILRLYKNLPYADRKQKDAMRQELMPQMLSATQQIEKYKDNILVSARRNNLRPQDLAGVIGAEIFNRQTISLFAGEDIEGVTDRLKALVFAKRVSRGLTQIQSANIPSLFPDKPEIKRLSYKEIGQKLEEDPSFAIEASARYLRQLGRRLNIDTINPSPDAARKLRGAYPVSNKGIEIIKRQGLLRPPFNMADEADRELTLPEKISHYAYISDTFAGYAEKVVFSGVSPQKIDKPTSSPITSTVSNTGLEKVFGKNGSSSPIIRIPSVIEPNDLVFALKKTDFGAALPSARKMNLDIETAGIIKENFEGKTFSSVDYLKAALINKIPKLKQAPVALNNLAGVLSALSTLSIKVGSRLDVVIQGMATTATIKSLTPSVVELGLEPPIPMPLGPVKKWTFTPSEFVTFLERQGVNRLAADRVVDEVTTLLKQRPFSITLKEVTEKFNMTPPGVNKALQERFGKNWRDLQIEEKNRVIKESVIGQLKRNSDIGNFSELFRQSEAGMGELIGKPVTRTNFINMVQNAFGSKNFADVKRNASSPVIESTPASQWLQEVFNTATLPVTKEYALEIMPKLYPGSFPNLEKELKAVPSGSWRPDIEIKGKISGSGALEIPVGDPSKVRIDTIGGTIDSNTKSLVDPSEVEVINKGLIESYGNVKVIDSNIRLLNEGKLTIIGDTNIVNRNIDVHIPKGQEVIIDNRQAPAISKLGMSSPVEVEPLITSTPGANGREIYLHRTSADNAASILKSGLKVPGMDLSTTASITSSDPSQALNQYNMSHKGNTHVVVVEFPRSELLKTGYEKISYQIDSLLEQNKFYETGIVPVKYIKGYIEKSTSEFTPNPKFSSLSAAMPVLSPVSRSLSC